MDTHEKVNEILEHHGVKGMHWGIRRSKDQLARKTPSRTSSDFKKTQEFRKRHASTLSNKQLKDVNERLNLEANFNRNRVSTIDKIERGNKKVKTILGVATTVATINQLSNNSLSKAAVKSGKKHVAKILLAAQLSKKIKR